MVTTETQNTNTVKNDVGKLKCDLCDYTCNDPRGLGRHKRTVHGIEGKSPAAIQWRKGMRWGRTHGKKHSASEAARKAAYARWNPELKLSAVEKLQRKRERNRHWVEANREKTRKQAREYYHRKKAERNGLAQPNMYVEGARPPTKTTNLNAVMNYCPQCGFHVRGAEQAIRGGILS